LDEGPSVKVTMGKVLALSPSLTVTGEQMDTALDIIDETIGWVRSQ